MKLCTLYLKILLWFKESGYVLSPREAARVPFFSPETISWALVKLSGSNYGSLKFQVQLPDGTIPETLWDNVRDIPTTIDGGSDVIPVFVKN
jgi:hypothetical protein